jgi:hypothetical protein
MTAEGDEQNWTLNFLSHGLLGRPVLEHSREYVRVVELALAGLREVGFA